MSNPLTASQESSFKILKSRNDHHESNASLPLLPQTDTHSITPPAATSSAADKRSNNHAPPPQHVKRAATFGESNPLLSERESIFATHYLPSDDNDQTPRLPAAEGTGDVVDLPQDLTTVMELALPSSPSHSSLSLKSLLSPTKLRFSQAVNNVGPQKPQSPSTQGSKRLEESGGTIHTVRRVASEDQAGKGVLQLGVRDRNQPFSLENTAVAARGKTPNVGKEEGKEKPGLTHESDRTPREPESAMREAVRETGSKERSASRGRTHVEKSIEATLPNREPAKNVRTRKSSHLMGIFKETASSELKRRDGQPRTTHVRHDEGPGGSMSLVEESAVSELHSQSELPEASASRVERVSRHKMGLLETTDRPFSGYFDDLPIYTEPNVSAAGPSTYSVSAPVSPLRTEHDPYFRKRDEIRQSIGGRGPIVPAKLHEDIRRRHTFTPAGDHNAISSQPIPSLLDVCTSQQPASAKALEVGNAEIHDYEDEEHISSAVYFPHPGPSDEDIEHFPSPGEDQRVEPYPASPTPTAPTPKVELKRTPSDLVPAEHIDISVRSKHEERVFHGDYQRVEEQSGDNLEQKRVSVVSDTALESASSASESETSSGEELSDHSQAEGEVTPTSTPVPKSPLQRRKRASTAVAPKGAVVLEPYSHQVGGHSTMFRFSRRAVCKQLNNRENEFYERIEQRHPDMLRFLPRLVLYVLFLVGDSFLPCCVLHAVLQ